MNIIEAIRAVSSSTSLTSAQANETFLAIMQGETTPAQIGALLTALKMKGESVEEIAGAAQAMRSKALQLVPANPKHLVDTCGTGGDHSNTFNISTAAAFVAAGAGAQVAKHGNRSITSKSGSADVLEALGVKITADPAVMQECLDTLGICFMFAPAYHGAMKHAVGPRKEIGIRTIFNILGPLTNPAGAKAQIMGVFAPHLTSTIARVLQMLGSERAFVVHGTDGLDEISLCAPTKVAQLHDSVISEYEVVPEDFGLTTCKPHEIKGGDSNENALIIRDILGGESGPRRDITVLNAAFALVAAGCAATPEEGITLACQSIDSGKAAGVLEQLVRRTARSY